MDILRTAGGRAFCRHLNTRGKRAARRTLMQVLRRTKSAIQHDLAEKFGGKRFGKDVTPEDVRQCVLDTADRLAGPDPSRIRIERIETGDGSTLAISGDPSTMALIVGRMAEATRIKNG